MYAIKVVCNQALDQDGYCIVREDEVTWLVEDEYYARTGSGTQHLCPKRLAFVREQISKYECSLAASEQS